MCFFPFSSVNKRKVYPYKPQVRPYLIRRDTLQTFDKVQN